MCQNETKRISEARIGFKKFVESYRCRICKIQLNLDNFGGLGENHGIFCKLLLKISGEII